MSDYRERFEREREWRHRYGATCRDWLVDEGDCCPECNGSGYVTYGDTSTWRGGVGGQMLTLDVCSKCWGSGSKSRPWPSHQKPTGGQHSATTYRAWWRTDVGGVSTDKWTVRDPDDDPGWPGQDDSGSQDGSG